MDAPLLSVVIPVYDQFPLTRDCLLSLREHTPRTDIEIIVVDNGSSDATANELEPLGDSLFAERFHAIRLDENRNFGPACNLGANAARGELLFFLNNDSILTSGWLEPLLAALAKRARQFLWQPRQPIGDLGWSAGA